jgi:hypothetical protein
MTIYNLKVCLNITKEILKPQTAQLAWNHSDVNPAKFQNVFFLYEGSTCHTNVHPPGLSLFTYHMSNSTGRGPLS